MKYLAKIISAFYLIVFTVSCNKEVVSDVDFQVNTEKLSYKLNDTVSFSFTGNPDIISLYSGEPGFEYTNRNRTSKEGGTFNFSFQTRPENAAVLNAIRSGALKVLVSTNFTATYASPVNASRDSNTVNTATWTDVTSRFPAIDNTWPVNTFFPASTTEVNLTDLVKNASDPFFIAFKYAAPTTAIFGNNGITIGSLNLNSVYTDGTSTIFNVAPGGSVSTTWKAVNATSSNNAWTTSTTQLKLATTAITNSYSEQWVISNAFYPKTATPDKAIPIKNITNPILTKYSFRFSKIGTYKVVFVASNNRVIAQEAITKEFTITITP